MSSPLPPTRPSEVQDAVAGEDIPIHIFPIYIVPIHSIPIQSVPNLAAPNYATETAERLSLPGAARAAGAEGAEGAAERRLPMSIEA